MTNFAILIIAFRRPNELVELVNSSSGSGNKVYVYVDFDENLSAENQEVIQIAKKLQTLGKVKCLINSNN
jgi:GT2 family glycosyltransferase